MRWSPVTYWWPGEGGRQWQGVLDYAGDGSVAVLNSLDWPEPINPAWRAAADAVWRAGATPLVYVPTHMGMALDPGRLGEGRADAGKYTVDEVLAQTRRAVAATGAGGVFLDETSSMRGAHAERASWYRSLVRLLKAEHGHDFVVCGNPGVSVDATALAIPFDILVTFEDTADQYLRDDRNDWLAQTPEQDTAIPSRIWHIVRECSPDQAAAVVAKARKLHAGHLYVTDRGLEPGDDRLGVPKISPYAGPPSSELLTALSRALKTTQEGAGMAGTIVGTFTDLEGRPLRGQALILPAPRGNDAAVPLVDGALTAVCEPGFYRASITVPGMGVFQWDQIKVTDGRATRITLGTEATTDGGAAVIPEPPAPGPGHEPPQVPDKFVPAPYLEAYVANEGQTSTMPINVLGDSWTGGDVTDFDGVKRTENRWEKVLKAQHLNNFTVNPQAISGQLTGDFLLYTGAIPLVVTGIEGGKIPGDTTTEKRLVLKDAQFFQKWAKLLMPTVVNDNSKYRTYWLADGLAGTRVNILLRKDDSGYYFTAKRGSAGGEVNVPNGEYTLSFNMGADIRKSAQFIIELGINDAFQWDASYAPEKLTPAEFAKRYIANLKAIIEKAGSEYAGTQKKHLAVLTIPPMSGEAPDTSRRKLIDAANAAIKKEFGPLVIDIASYLTSEQALKDAGVSITSGDREDLANKSLPRSLMGSAGGANKLDNTHMNTAGHKALAKFVGDAIKQRKWVAGV